MPIISPIIPNGGKRLALGGPFLKCADMILGDGSDFGFGMGRASVRRFVRSITYLRHFNLGIDKDDPRG